MRALSPWMRLVEERAYRRLRQLRARGLWDGSAPVPIDHLLEHILQLTISWEVVQEPPGSVVLACLRPETREVVLNETHADLLQEKRGLLGFCKAHEGGHADVFALAQASEQHRLLGVSAYRPWRCSAAKGDVAVIIQERLRGLAPEHRREVMREIVRLERERQALGEDSDFERRTVDHYAAALLMPSDLIRTEMARRNPTNWSELYEVAERLAVSISALTIRLRELGIIFDIKDGTIRVRDQASENLNLW